MRGSGSSRGWLMTPGENRDRREAVRDRVQAVVFAYEAALLTPGDAARQS